jgi:hypothetical protein
MKNTAVYMVLRGSRVVRWVRVGGWGWGSDQRTPMVETKYVFIGIGVKQKCTQFVFELF